MAKKFDATERVTLREFVAFEFRSLEFRMRLFGARNQALAERLLAEGLIAPNPKYVKSGTGYDILYPYNLTRDGYIIFAREGIIDDADAAAKPLSSEATPAPVAPAAPAQPEPATAAEVPAPAAAETETDDVEDADEAGLWDVRSALTGAYQRPVSNAEALREIKAGTFGPATNRGGRWYVSAKALEKWAMENRY